MGTGEGPLDAAAAGLRAGRMVAFVGGRGAGRTTTLRGLAAQTRGRRVIEVRGRPGFSDQPLAVFGELGRDGPSAVVAALLADGRPPLIAVDDPHHLSAVDLAVLDVAAQAGARLAWTATSEAPSSPALAALLAGAQRIPLPPLDDIEVERLATELLGGARLDALDIRSLSEVTGARPGLIARLLRGADVEVDGDLAILPTDLGAMPGAIAWRTVRVDDEALHRACRLAARRSTLTRDEVATVTGGRVVERALAEGLLEVDGDRLAVPDPLLAATLAGADRRTHGREDAAELLRAHGDRADHARRRRWRAEAGEVLAPDERAALMEELLDQDQPHEALRLGAGGGDTPRLLMATARARVAVGAIEIAVETLQRVLADDATSDTVRGAATLLLGDLLWFRNGDAAAALRVLDGAADVAPDAVALADLLRSALGQPLTSTRAGSVPSTPVARQVFDLRAVLAGRVRGADDVAPPTVASHPSGIPLRQRSFANRRMAALYGDGAKAAVPHTERELADAWATGRPGALALGLVGRAELERFEGRLVDAERTLRAARARARVDDEAGITTVLAAVHASVLAELGRLDEAKQALPSDDVEAVRDLRVLLVGAPAAIRVTARTDVEAAVVHAREVLAAARASGHIVWGVHAALHVARIGFGAAVVDEVRAVADHVSGSTAAAVSAVVAFVDGGSLARHEAAQSCAASGQRRVAAELLLAGGAATGRDLRHAAALLDGLGPPNPNVGSVGVLTDRERQVAALAADGRTSREVAGLLGLSVRTVDNHLRRVYDKLGLEGRDQLAQVLTG